MERSTKRNDDGSVEYAMQCKSGCKYLTCSMEEGYQCGHQCEADVVCKLADYEDAEEQGLLTKVAHGHWSLVAFSRGIKVCKCSVCNNNQYGSTQYCGNCGAKMDGEESEKKLAEMKGE